MRYRTNDGFHKDPDKPGRPIPDEWRFELPKGYTWTTSSGNVPEDSWLYISSGPSVAFSRMWWMSWAVNTDKNVMLMGKLGGEPPKHQATRPAQLQRIVFRHAALERLGIEEGAP